VGRPSKSFLHALGRHPSHFLRSFHCAFAHLFALFSNALRLPTDEIALNLEQVLRTPGLDDLKREVEAVSIVASVRDNNRPRISDACCSTPSKASRAVVREPSHMVLL
jgi:hypothetical protein